MEFNLADLFEAVADTLPDGEALVLAGEPGRRFTYRQLDERTTRLAHSFAAAGVGAGDHVALYLRNGPEYLEAMLAAFKLRAVPVNVNHRYVAAELRHVLLDSAAVALVHEPDLAPTVDEVAADVPGIRLRLPTGPAYEEAIAAGAAVRDFGMRSAADHYVLYTGGTTGTPRGVVWRHEDIFFAALCSGATYQRPEDVTVAAGRGNIRCLPASPLGHGSAQWMALATLYRGGTVVVSRAGFDALHVWDVVEAERVSFLVIVGDAFARPLVDALDAEPDRWDLSSLTVVLSGGAVLSPAVRQELTRRLPAVMVVDGFGASETGGQGQMVATAGAPGESAGLRFRVNEETAVLADDLSQPLEPGDGRTGWLARRGHIPVGYRNDRDATARTFPVIGGVRWAVPGDRAHVEQDGTVVVHGRGSTSINSGGEKVHPEEVEAVLKGHPDVFDAVVVGVPDERWGERVCAVVHPRAGRRPDLAELAAHCRSRLAGFKVPRRLVLVGSVERTLSGKADYRWARGVAERG